MLLRAIKNTGVVPCSWWLFGLVNLSLRGTWGTLYIIFFPFVVILVSLFVGILPPHLCFSFLLSLIKFLFQLKILQLFSYGQKTQQAIFPNLPLGLTEVWGFNVKGLGGQWGFILLKSIMLDSTSVNVGILYDTYSVILHLESWSNSIVLNWPALPHCVIIQFWASPWCTTNLTPSLLGCT